MSDEPREGGQSNDNGGAPDAAALLAGPAAIEPGQPPERVWASLSERNPHAAKRGTDNAAARAQHVQRYETLLRERFGVEPSSDGSGPPIPAERHFEFAAALKEELGYRMYVTCCASHWPEQKSKSETDPEHYEVATVLRIPGPGSHTARWRVRLAVPGEIDSLTPLFAGADWQEREQYDLVGVQFRGHPDLRRLMLPDEWEGHPLRKDYAIDTRCVPWR